jgi:hypothetical protein
MLYGEIMENNPHTDPLAIPPALLAQVQAAAEEEHRPIGGVLCDALQRYLRERRWQKAFTYGEQQAQSLGIGAADIPRLIAEYRQRHSKAAR